MSQWLNRRQPWGSLVLRLALALSMMVHGYEKVVPAGALHRFVHHIGALGLPSWLGYVFAFTELVGGIMILLGLFTRFASALAAVDMLVTLFGAGFHQSFQAYSYVAALAAIALMLVFTGGGVMSADRKFGIS